MDRIDIGDSVLAAPKSAYFARCTGTEFKAQAVGTDAAQIELFDEIGYWGVTAKDFSDQLKTLTGDLTLKINSPGGNVFDGIAMYNALLAYKGRVRVEVVGLAASAASIVAMAGSEIAIAPNAFLMIHNAWVFAMGNRHDLMDAAGVLAKIDAALVKTYATRASIGQRTIATMMDDETWLGADEAKAKGFVTEIMKAAEEPKAKFDLSVFAHIPDALQVDDEDFGVTHNNERDIERSLMRDARQSRSQARAIVRAWKATPEAAKPGAGEEGAKAFLQSMQDIVSQLPTIA